VRRTAWKRPQQNRPRPGSWPAQQATEAVLEALRRARDALELAAYVNGTGILADPSGTGDDVKTALEQLERVQAVLAATNWPTTEDYDAV
jgi:hypothetical protein